MTRSNEQKLIDIMFQIAQHSAIYWSSGPQEKYYSDKREEHMAWVAEQLRECGFDTQPIGSSWGSLKEPSDLINRSDAIRAIGEI